MKCWPNRPETKEPALEDQVFTDLTLAETIKARLEEYLPHRCFTIEPVLEPSNERATERYVCPIPGFSSPELPEVGDRQPL